ncbi:hypothetical protein A9978_18895 [Pseudomonas sp. UMC65]|uniref:hypothetical protein n=1 Tax=Pseudomonas sp. UMC65 TaxID=1862323 RepID=UPI00160410A3|nr:hypothetical protein [Pseudomonas sp. UMC65]MBB1614508.1 hypothetical protein [Pseudomonas sp. UMC65]
MKLTNSETCRGFSLIEFKDRYGAKCSIQASSLASEEAIWFGLDDAEPKIMASQAAAHGVATTEICGWVEYPIPDAVSLNTRMHLTREQVEALLPILQRFVDTGEVVA